MSKIRAWRHEVGVRTPVAAPKKSDKEYGGGMTKGWSASAGTDSGTGSDAKIRFLERRMTSGEGYSDIHKKNDNVR